MTVTVETPRLLIPAPRHGAAEGSTHPDVHRLAPPGEPAKLSPAELARVHAETLEAPRRRYSAAARMLFLTMNMIYGRKKTLAKYRVLEIVARTPYQTWEKVSYKRINKVHHRIALVRRIHERIATFRAQQDNEQWHLLILSELVAASGKKQGRLRFRLLPRLIASSYWHFCCLLFVMKPGWSYRLNADFEDHAEHEYAEFVRDNPELETTPYNSVECVGYGSFDSVADLFRQIMHDERCHKQESELHLMEPRLR